MKPTDENLVIDLIKNQKFSNAQASGVLKERCSGVRDL